MTIFGGQRCVPSSKKQAAKQKVRRREFQRRALGAESLEQRALMDAGEISFIRNAFWNINKPTDVNADGQVTAMDALRIINELNTKGARSLSTGGVAAAPSAGEDNPGPSGQGYLDVNNDNFVSAMDVLQVINRLNNPSAGEGEQMVKMTVQIVAPGTNTDLTTVAKGGFYEVRILAEDLGVLTYMGETRPTNSAPPPTGTGETLLGVVTTFFDVQYNKSVTEFQVNEIQNIAITNGTNGGDFTLTVNDNGTLKTTGPIDFAGNRDVVTGNIQAALNTLLGDNVIEVTRGTGNNWRLRFINRLADRDVPAVVGNNISLGGSAAITATEVQSGLPNNALSIAEALRLKTFYDPDGNPLNDDPVFYRDQRNGNKDTFGINDVGGSNFNSPYPGTTATEIVRLRFTANDAGVVPFNLSYLDVNGGLPTGVLGFSNAVTTDLITIVNDTITIVEPLSAGDDSTTLVENATASVDINVTANDVNNPPTPNTAKTVQSVTTPTVGTVQIISASTIRYIPPGTDFNGPATFTYTVTDQNGNSDTATVTINFTAVNDAPVVGGPSSQTINEDTTRVFSNINGNQITITDVDAGAGLVTMTLNVGAGNGNLTLASLAGLTGVSGNGSSSVTATGTVGDLNVALDGLSYSPALNVNGTVTLAITANDNGNSPAPALQGSRNITLNLTAVNDAPNVELGGVVGTPDVVEGDPLVLGSATNSLIQVSDPDAGTNQVLVTLHVTAGNLLHVNTTAGVVIGTNDTNNVTLTGTLAAINTALNGITYTPSATFGGNNESLQITINDQGASGAVNNPLSDTDTVTIIVDTSTRPRARADVKTVAEDSSLPATNTIDVLGNDIVNVPDPTVYVAELLSFDATSVNGGTITRDDNLTPADFSDDKLIYVPAPNFFGTDTFTYTMTDTKLGSTPAVGTVTVTVTAVNDAPVPAADTLTNIAEDSGARIILASDLTGNDSRGAANESAQTLTIAAVSNPVGGTVSINGAGNVVFTPTANYNGPASFDYTVTDNGQTNGANDFKTSLTSATVSFTITEVNDVPTSGGDVTIGNIAEDSPTCVIPIATLLASFSPGPANESGQMLTLVGVLAPNGGTVAIVGSNVEFTPTPNFNAASGLRFILNVFDNGTTNGAPVPLNASTGVFFAITPVNDAPVAQADTASTGEGQQIDVAVLANDRDVDVNPPSGTAGQVQAGTTISIISQTPAPATSGTVSVTAGNQIRFVPATGFFGQVVIEYQLNDNSGAANNLSNITTLTIDVVEANDPPVANNDTATLAEDPATAVAIDILANDTDPDTAKALWSVTIVTPPQHGTAVFNTTTRVIDYTPAANYNGSDSFVYRVNDNSPINPQNLSSGNATVSITVTEVNDAPVGGVDPATGEITVIMDGVETFTVAELLANDSPGLPANESGQSLSITGVTAGSVNGTVTLNAGVITYTPAIGFIGSDFFEYTLTDNGTTAGAADPKSVQVRVNLIVRDFVPSDVNGFVYRDVNNNGSYDLNIDFPLSGVEVTLSGTSEITGAITPITVETNHLGFYEFLAVEPGDYLLTETQPLALSDGGETLGAAASFFANDKIALDLPLLGLTGGVSRNNFGEGAINANALVNSAGLSSELLGSSSQNGFVLGTDLNANTIWSWALNNWAGATSIKVDLDLSDMSKATLTVTDANGAHAPIDIFQNPNDPRNSPAIRSTYARFRILGWDAAGNYMIRIDGKASDFGLTLAAAPLAAGEYIEGVDAAMAEESWA